MAMESREIPSSLTDTVNKIPIDIILKIRT